MPDDSDDHEVTRIPCECGGVLYEGPDGHTPGCPAIGGERARLKTVENLKQWEEIESHEDKINVCLAELGLEGTAEFWDRYQTDTWVYVLTNALVLARHETYVTREGMRRRVIESQAEADRLEEERDRYRQHSIKLNEVTWRLAVALGEVEPGETSAEVDVDELVDRILKDYD